MFYYTTVFLQQTGSQKHETNSQLGKGKGTPLFILRGYSGILPNL